MGDSASLLCIRLCQLSKRPFELFDHHRPLIAADCELVPVLPRRPPAELGSRLCSSLRVERYCVGTKHDIIGKDLVHMCIEVSVRIGCRVGEKLRRARVCSVKVKGDLERVAYHLVGGMVHDYRQRVKVGVVQVLPAGGSANPLADIGDLCEFGPTSLVIQAGMDTLEVEGIPVSKRSECDRQRLPRKQDTNRVLQGFGAYGRMGGPEAMS